VPGFTLIELMIAVMAAAILAAIAIPSFEVTINNSRLATASNEFLVSLQTARMQAIRFNRRTAVCLSNNATTANPTCAPPGTTTANGWITYLDANSNNQFAGADTLLGQTTLPTNVQVRMSPSLRTGAAPQISFRADGFARDPINNNLLTGNVDMCLPVRRPLENVRRLNFMAGGRSSISRVNTNEVCNAPGNP
jgi:type IV fimbrial biogenesis protein FimT